MMTLLRKRMATIFLILAIAFVITIVFDWGMGGFQPGMKPGVVAEVNGEEITRDQYQTALENRFAYERQTNQNAEIDDRRAKQLRKEVWEGVINEVLLQQALKRSGLEVTNAEVAYNVRNNPPQNVRQSFVDSTGQFDRQMYEQVLSDPQYVDVVLSLEENTRRNLLQQKMIQRIAGGVHVSEAEARHQYRWNNTMLQADYVFIPATKMDVDSSLVSEDELRAEYEMRKDPDFQQVAKRHAEFVLFPDKPSEEDTTAARGFVLELRDRIASGANFSDVAKEYSQDASSEQGGALGWFGRGKMVDEFEEAAFNADIGELVGPVQTRYGFHLIVVDDKRGSGDDEEVYARHILIKIERSPQTLDEIASRADAFREEATSSGFLDAARVYSVEVDTLKEIRETGYIPRFGQNQAVVDFLFRRKLGSISPVYRFTQGYVVMRAYEAIPAGFRPFEEVRKTLQKDLLLEHQFDVARDKAREVYEQFREVGVLERAASDLGFEMKNTDEFKPNEFVSGIGRDPNFVITALNMEPGTVSEPVKGDKGWFIIKLEKREEADMSKFASNKEQARQELFRERQRAAYDKWVELARDNANIEDYRYMYYTDF
ncbi:hypothetical protein GF324_01260 [bacterium]|nr:hypothetical protein [bacterium]